MASYPPESPGLAPATPLGALSGTTDAARITALWAALHEATGIVAAMAGAVDNTRSAQVLAFPAAITATGGWRLRLARQGLDDLNAILSTGITALLCVHRSGGNAAAPAQALWEEFLTARDGLIALCPDEALERRRLA
jgi:hypothetical protein